MVEGGLRRKLVIGGAAGSVLLSSLVGCEAPKEASGSQKKDPSLTSKIVTAMEDNEYEVNRFNITRTPSTDIETADIFVDGIDPKGTKCENISFTVWEGEDKRIHWRATKYHNGDKIKPPIPNGGQDLSAGEFAKLAPKTC